MRHDTYGALAALVLRRFYLQRELRCSRTGDPGQPGSLHLPS
jgi:hypothetical protein